jgi:hypothetical protein
MYYAGVGKQPFGGQRPFTFPATSYSGWWRISSRPNALVTSMLRAGAAWTKRSPPKQLGRAQQASANRFRDCGPAPQWNGHMQRVSVLPDGFAWNGKTYRSLSQVAFAITGTRWNGPRFFGLRDKSAKGTSA